LEAGRCVNASVDTPGVWFYDTPPDGICQGLFTFAVLRRPRVKLAGDGLGNQGGAVFLEQLDLPAESGEKGVNAGAFGFDVGDDGALFGKDRRPR
jgi:hypothetical protein